MADLPNTLGWTKFDFPGQTGLYHGKVRDVYMLGGRHLAIIATDRISAFDEVLPVLIPYKGQILNKISDYFLSDSKVVAENWLMESNDPNVSFGVRADPYKIEVVVRDCLAGSAWRDYQSGKREIGGNKIPDGMREYSKFSEGPIITPTTKNDNGHDEAINPEQIVAGGLATKEEWNIIAQKSLDLFAHGQKVSDDKGLYLADSKYEFGKYDEDIILIDEVHTPDSSRYFYKESFEAFSAGDSQIKPKHLSKEFVREWLMDHGYGGGQSQTIPPLSDEFITEISNRYIALYEKLTGKTFEPVAVNIEDRIEKYINECVRKYINKDH